MKFNPFKKSINMTKTSQSGRSMTEIIGVLILVGILSVGALAGYGWAVDKYRSNTLNREILQRAVDIKNQLDRRHRDVNLDKFEPVSLIGVEIGLASGDDDKIGTVNGETTVGIQVDHVPGRVCQMTFDGNIGLFDIKVEGKEFAKKTNENTSNACSKDKNTMIFYIDDAWEYNRNKPTETETTENCPTINCTSSDQCLYGESCINGCCVEDTEVFYSSDIQLSSISDITSASDISATDISSVLSTETTEKNKYGYCVKEEWSSSKCTKGQNKNGLPIYVCVYSSTCTEYDSTDAQIMQDPTRSISKDYRAREIPMVGELEGKYPYCALVINGKCALVSYCDEKPTSIGELLQMCEACPPYDPITHTCVGNKVISHREAKALDGEKVLYHYLSSSKSYVTPNDYPINSVVPTEPESESCYVPNDCPAGKTKCPDGTCQSNAWFDCSGDCSYIDACGYTRPNATICCPGSWNGPSRSCGSIGHPTGCFGSGAVRAAGGGIECCNNVCYDGSWTSKYCCASQADAQTGKSCCNALGGTWIGTNRHGRCDNLPVSTYPIATETATATISCGSEHDSKECCEAYGDDCVYEADMGTCCCGTGGCGQRSTTTPYDSDTTSPLDSDTTSPYDSDTTSPLDSDTTSPYGSDTTAPEPTTPTGTGPTTTTPSGTGTTPTTTTTETTTPTTITPRVTLPTTSSPRTSTTTSNPSTTTPETTTETTTESTTTETTTPTMTTPRVTLPTTSSPRTSTTTSNPSTTTPETTTETTTESTTTETTTPRPTTSVSTTTETTTPRPTTTLTRTTEITAPNPTATRTTETTAPAPTTTTTRTTTTATRTTETTAPAPTTTTTRTTTTLTRTTETTTPTPKTTSTTIETTSAGYNGSFFQVTTTY